MISHAKMLMTTPGSAIPIAVLHIGVVGDPQLIGGLRLELGVCIDFGAGPHRVGDRLPPMRDHLSIL